MKYITDLLNEVNSINVISENYYFVGQVTISETDRIDHGIDKNSLREFKSKMFLTINKSNEADLKRLYNSAKTELTSLSKDQLINVRKILLSYNYKYIFKKIGEFFVKVYEGKQHPTDELEFRLFLNSNFICNIPENGDFSSYFLTNLIDEYSNKRGFIDLLIDDINNLLNDAEPAPQSVDIQRKYKVDYSLFTLIYNYCQGKKPVFNIDEIDFFDRVARADFSGNITTKSNKGKIRTLIHSLVTNGIMNEDWYSDSVDSINIVKGDCSGYKHNIAFLGNLNEVIKAYKNIKMDLETIDLSLKNDIEKKLKQLNPT